MAKLSDQKFIHSVYFWLKRDLSAEQIESFEKGLESLTTIENVKQGFIGIPAPTNRPIIDRTYDNSLILIFENKEQHDIYQEHPVHEEFRQRYGDFWIKVSIFDTV